MPLAAVYALYRLPPDGCSASRMIGVLLAMMRLHRAIPHSPRNAHERSEFGIGSLLLERL